MLNLAEKHIGNNKAVIEKEVPIWVNFGVQREMILIYGLKSYFINKGKNVIDESNIKIFERLGPRSSR